MPVLLHSVNTVLRHGRSATLGYDGSRVMEIASRSVGMRGFRRDAGYKCSSNQARPCQVGGARQGCAAKCREGGLRAPGDAARVAAVRVVWGRL